MKRRRHGYALAGALATAGQSERAVREREAAKMVAAAIGALGLLRRAARRPGQRLDATSQNISGIRARARGARTHRAGLEQSGRSASALTLSPFTVKRHVANILTKLDLSSRAAAALLRRPQRT